MDSYPSFLHRTKLLSHAPRVTLDLIGGESSSFSPPGTLNFEHETLGVAAPPDSGLPVQACSFSQSLWPNAQSPLFSCMPFVDKIKTFEHEFKRIIRIARITKTAETNPRTKAANFPSVGAILRDRPFSPHLTNIPGKDIAFL